MKFKKIFIAVLSAICVFTAVPAPQTIYAAAATTPLTMLQGLYARNKTLFESPAYLKRIDMITAQNKEFYVTEITDSIWKRIKGKSYKDNCTLSREDLRYIHVLHKDLNGGTHEGEMICNVYIAADVLEILKALYDADYPIEKIKLIDEYNADDEASMEDNNSSSFNFRTISYSTKISKHGLGMAVDINTLYNPYIKQVNGQTHVEPANALPYTDRSKSFAYKIDENDLCYRLFTAHGFEWGGSWKNRKDYQHFEVPDSVISALYPDNR